MHGCLGNNQRLLRTYYENRSVQIWPGAEWSRPGDFFLLPEPAEITVSNSGEMPYEVYFTPIDPRITVDPGVHEVQLVPIRGGVYVQLRIHCPSVNCRGSAFVS